MSTLCSSITALARPRLKDGCSWPLQRASGWRKCGGSPAAGALDKLLRDEITARKLDIVSLDPFVKSHGVPENDNNAIDYVCTALASIAIQFDCAIDFPHHTRKGGGGAGNADAGRGASSNKDAGRLVYTLTQMTEEEAETFGISEEERRGYVRYDSAKVNIAPPSRKARWFEIVGVPLGNATELYPKGDEVQTVEPWKPPSLWDGLEVSLINRILDQLARGLPDGSRYSAANAARERAAWQVVTQHAPDKNKKQAQEIIKTWLSNGVLREEEYQDPTRRAPAKGLFVNQAQRPS